MSEKKDFTQDNKKGFLKVILFFFLSLLLLLGVAAGVLQIPAVQTAAVKKLTNYLSEKTGFPTQIKQVQLRWFDALTLKEVRVYDRQDSLMIGIEEAFIDFRLSRLLDKQQPALDEIALNRPRVQMLKNTPEGGLNLNEFIRNLRQLLPEKKEGPKTYTPFYIHDVVVHEGSFRFHDPAKDSLQDMFDHNHMNLQHINGRIENFRLLADTLEFRVEELQLTAPVYDFSVDKLQTFFRFTEQSMLFDDLLLQAGNSTIQDSLHFSYRSPEVLEYFVDSVQIGANLQGTKIHSRDLAVFAPYFKDFNDTFLLGGHFTGTVANFHARDIDLQLGQSHFEGTLHMDGLPDFNETFIEASLKNSRLYPPDFKPYFSEQLYQNLQRLGETEFSSHFLGFPNDFVANGQFSTRLGYIRSDINLKLNTDKQDLSTYSGTLALQNFSLGRLLQEPDLGKISMNGKINGQGFSMDAANLRLNATIARLDYQGYPYRNIKTNGKLARSFFEGQLEIRDPNLQLAGRGSVDLRNNKQLVKANARIDTVFLQPLGLSDEEVFFSAQVDLDVSGLKLDELQGDVSLASVYLQYKNRDLSLDTLSFFSTADTTGRRLIIESDKVDIHANGNFDYTTLAGDVERLYTEYALNFRNNTKEIEAYYADKTARSSFNKYKIDYVVKLKDVNPLIHLLEPQLSISGNTQLEGSFTGGYTSILSANTFIDTLQYKEDVYYQLEAELNTSKIADSTDVLAMAFLHSTEQQLAGLAATEQLVLEAIWDSDHIDFSGDIQQQNSENHARLNAEVSFLENQTELRFHESDIQLLENIWQVSKDNRVVFEEGSIRFENFRISNQDQDILAEGVLSPDPEKQLNVKIENFKLANLNPVLEQRLQGAVNGNMQLKDVFNRPLVNGRLNVGEFRVDNFLVGDISFDTRWDQKEEHLDVSLEAVRNSIQVLSAEGFYNPFVEENNLHIDATLNKTNLDLIEPFTSGIFSAIRGTASGQLLITGTPRYPVLRGGGQVSNGHIKIDYTNTAYTFNGGFIFAENEIGFRGLQIKDTDNNPAQLDGGIFHDGFDNFIINLKARLEGTKVLNTSYQDNNLYYGTAYAIGDLEVLGPINNLQFIGSAKTAKGTKIYIPIDFGTDFVQEDFIHFVSKKDSLPGEEEVSKNINLSGIKLDFDLEITPDAYCEIIFDMRAGDIIRGRGNGKLELQIDTQGDFTMFGNYEIQQGAYNFTLFNIITKEFIIEPGSTIRWVGDPYGGLMDIQAHYRQSASLLPILNRTQGKDATPQEARPYPVMVQMDLEGDLLSPTIDFDIDIRDYPGVLYSDVQRFLSQVAVNEQYLNRQVFNLIVLRQFAPDNANQNAVNFGSQTAISSISELLSNQFSALATQIDENLEIDLDVSSSMYSEAINTLQLRLSYTFLDGRLRITRDGSLTSRPEQQGAANLIGDWSVEVLLTPDGTYKLRVYSRNNMNDWGGPLRLNDYTQGVSFSQTKRFDSLKELFQKKKKPAEKGPIEIQDNNADGLLREEELQNPAN